MDMPSPNLGPVYSVQVRVQNMDSVIIENVVGLKYTASLDIRAIRRLEQ